VILQKISQEMYRLLAFYPKQRKVSIYTSIPDMESGYLSSCYYHLVQVLSLKAIVLMAFILLLSGHRN